jgi:hypothetical protein
MAYLQRIVNGGGRVGRECALGRGRVDLLIEFKTQNIAVELKLKAATKKNILEALSQVADYMDTKNATEGHLIFFDRSQKKSWDKKIFHKKEKYHSKTIHVWGM